MNNLRDLSKKKSTQKEKNLIKNRGILFGGLAHVRGDVKDRHTAIRATHSEALA